MAASCTIRMRGCYRPRLPSGRGAKRRSGRALFGSERCRPIAARGWCAVVDLRACAQRGRVELTGSNLARTLLEPGSNLARTWASASATVTRLANLTRDSALRRHREIQIFGTANGTSRTGRRARWRRLLAWASAGGLLQHRVGGRALRVEARGGVEAEEFTKRKKA